MIRRATPPPKSEEKTKSKKDEPKKKEEPKEKTVKTKPSIDPILPIPAVNPVQPEPKKEEPKKGSEWDGIGLSGGLDNVHVRKFRGLAKEHGHKVGELLLGWIKEYNIKNPSK